MLRLFIISAAVSLYAIAAGCVLLSGAAEQQQSQNNALYQDTDRARSAAPTSRRGQGDLPIRAVGIQIQRTDWMDQYKQSIDEIAELGADGVKLVVDARQEDGTSNR